MKKRSSSFMRKQTIHMALPSSKVSSKTPDQSIRKNKNIAAAVSINKNASVEDEKKEVEEPVDPLT